MRRENIAEYNRPSNDAFASVVRSFGETNSRFQALVVQSVGRAVEIQSQFVGKAYDTYVSEISKLGRMFFAGYSPFTARPQELPHANLNEKRAADRPQDLDPARRRTVAQSLTTKRKIGTVAKSQSGSKRSAKAKRKVGSVRRGKS
jgi:hypothetical protein